MRPTCRAAPSDRLLLNTPASHRAESLDPALVVCGPVLCRLRLWTPAEWDALAKHRRPAHVTFAPGLGWVGAVPVAVMN